MKLSCVFCRSGNFCPMHTSETYFKIQNVSREQLASTSPPSVFIGSKLPYPRVNVGILAPPEKTENAWLYDAQRYWAEQNFEIPNIVKLRSNLINSRFQTEVREARTAKKFLELAQELGMAAKPTNIDITFKKKIRINTDFDTINLPMGPTATLKTFQLAENPKIPNKVEKVVSDTDLKAGPALNYLSDQNFDEKTLTQLLSIGVLGLKKDRKLVPTRFAITAVDDTIGKALIENIQDYKILEDYKLFYANYLGNNYFILCFPDIFQYELFETYVSGQTWENKTTMHDYESLYGRKDYVKETAGGYYAARLSILQKLDNMKRQASVLVLRFITSEYSTPLGVFVCREATRKAMQTELSFASKEELIKNTKELIKQRLKYDCSSLLKQSQVLENVAQPKLTQFF